MAIEGHDFRRLMNQARVKLPGASDEGLKGEFFDVLLEFFNDSTSWIEQIPFTALANVTSYNIVPQEGGMIIRLGGVIDGFNTAQAALMPSLGTIVLGFVPSTTTSLFAVVAKNVVLPTTKDHVPDAPDWLLKRYHLYVLDGLLGKMYGQPKKSYSDATQSVYHLKRFRNGIAQARQDVLKANTSGARAWSFPLSVGSQRGGISVGNDLRFT